MHICASSVFQATAHTLQFDQALMNVRDLSTVCHTVDSQPTQHPAPTPCQLSKQLGQFTHSQLRTKKTSGCSSSLLLVTPLVGHPKVVQPWLHDTANLRALHARSFLLLYNDNWADTSAHASLHYHHQPMLTQIKFIQLQQLCCCDADKLLVCSQV